MSVVKEFKEFINRGSLVDIAVGMIIATAFGNIVNSLVNDMIMPPIGYIIGGIDFSKLGFAINEATCIAYGKFIQTIINFFIIAFSVFLLLRAVNSFKKKEAAIEAPAVKSEEEKLLTEIRDLLKNR
jgi:large conductance mechanosensitive channel